MPPYASLLGKRNCVLYSGKPGSLLGNMWNCWEQYRIYCKIRMLLMEMGKWKMLFLVTFLKKIYIFSYRNLYLDVSENKGYPDTPKLWWFQRGDDDLPSDFWGTPFSEKPICYIGRVWMGRNWNMKMHLFSSKSPSGLAFYAKFLAILRTYQHGHGKTHGTA